MRVHETNKNLAKVSSLNFSISELKFPLKNRSKFFGVRNKWICLIGLVSLADYPVGASSQCYREELMLLKCELMLLKFQHKYE